MNGHPLATALASAVADRALDRLGVHLADDVRMRALLPGGPTVDQGRDAVLDRYADWFGSFDTVVLVDSAGDDVGDRVLVHYKLAFDPEADRRILSQTLVCAVWDGLVGRIDLVCSGFRRY